MSETIRTGVSNMGDELDILELIREVWQFKWLLVGLFIVAILCAGAYSKFFVTPMYQTNALLQSGAAADINHIVNSPGFERHLNNGIDGFTSDEVSYALSSLSSTVTNNFIDISVQTRDPQLSYNLLNTVVSYIEKVQDQRISKSQELQLAHQEEIRSQIELSEQIIQRTQEQIDIMLSDSGSIGNADYLLGNLTINLGLHAEQRFNLLKEESEISQQLLNQNITIINHPFLPDRAVTANYKLNMAIAGVLALMLGMFIICVRFIFKN